MAWPDPLELREIPFDEFADRLNEEPFRDGRPRTDTKIPAMSCAPPRQGSEGIADARKTERCLIILRHGVGTFIQRVCTNPLAKRTLS